MVSEAVFPLHGAPSGWDGRVFKQGHSVFRKLILRGFGVGRFCRLTGKG